VRALTRAGLAIERVTGRGYKLERPLELLDERRLKRELAQHGVRAPVTILPQVDSTNRYLLERLAGLESGAAVLSETQSAGRGRRGRAWVASPYQNLMLSLAWQFAAGPAFLAGLSLAAGVAVTRALEHYGVSEVNLKWPNDILWNRKKLAGLLIELRGEATGPSWVVLGVGINGFVSDADAAAIDQPWADLARITSAPVARNRLAALVLAELHAMCARYARDGLAAFHTDFEARHCYHGERVRLVNGTDEQHGTVTGVDANGALLVRDAKGRVRAFHSGEISLRPA
jgi:BirA family biotin operon repressor/biotin-[acetyl-CoA-carboxylase] ligase